VKTSDQHQSATSLPPAPRDEVGRRSTRYLIMMGVRVLCFVLMVFIQPFGWYTWVFGAAAIFLPYIAVVLANVGQESKTVPAVGPERQLETSGGSAASAAGSPTVIRVAETHGLAAGAPDGDGATAAEPRADRTERDARTEPEDEQS
jgi:hypothetical protein